MLKNRRHLWIASAVILVMVFVAALSQAQNTPVRSLYTIAQMRVENIAQRDLWEFMCDLRNEARYYPGIEEVVLLREGTAGICSAGTIYLQATGENAQNEITILEADAPHYIVIKSTNTAMPDISYIATFYFAPTEAPNTTTYTLIATLNDDTVTPDDVIAAHDNFLQQLLTALNTTGSVTINNTFYIDAIE